ncbi:MAG: CsbD family protein [Acidimicrobiales bacterium]
MGVGEELKGKAKAAVGEVVDNDNLRREGEAQVDKGKAEVDAAKSRADAKAEEAKARVHEERQRGAQEAK